MTISPHTLFDDLGRIKQDYILSIITCLCSLTEKKTQNAVANAIDVAQSVVSQMKNGTAFLNKKHLTLFAQKYHLADDELLTILVQNISNGNLSSSVSPHAAHTSDPPKITDAAFVILDETKRQQFLIALQDALAINEGMLFTKKLNEEPQSEIHTNYQTFIMTGQVPSKWLREIADPSVRERITRDYDPKRSINPPMPPQRSDKSSPVTSKPQTTLQVCATLSAVPKEFLDGFFHACIAAGKAVHLKLAAEAFLGTLALKLCTCSITSRMAHTKDVLIITIQSDKNRIEYHLKLHDLS